MAISGIGVDIESISRFRKKPYKDNKAFYNKIFTSDEINYCLSKKEPYQHFAARFCAKEAFVKALGKPVDYKLINVVRKGNGTSISCVGKKYPLSLSHDRENAIAFVVIEKSNAKKGLKRSYNIGHK